MLCVASQEVVDKPECVRDGTEAPCGAVRHIPNLVMTRSQVACTHDRSHDQSTRERYLEKNQWRSRAGSIAKIIG